MQIIRVGARLLIPPALIYIWPNIHKLPMEFNVKEQRKPCRAMMWNLNDTVLSKC